MRRGGHREETFTDSDAIIDIIVSGSMRFTIASERLSWLRAGSDDRSLNATETRRMHLSNDFSCSLGQSGMTNLWR